MFTFAPIVLSYHHFTDQLDEYPFSRTFDQFRHDIAKKVFDIITIDDARSSMIKACSMMQEKNIRAKLFVPTSLIGSDGYCSWDQLRELSKFHDIENHSHLHTDLTRLSDTDIAHNINRASMIITEMIEKPARFFVPPFNTFNAKVEEIAKAAGLILIKDRITIKNDTR